jgi:hypothetical protein
MFHWKFAVMKMLIGLLAFFSINIFASVTSATACPLTKLEPLELPILFRKSFYDWSDSDFREAAEKFKKGLVIANSKAKLSEIKKLIGVYQIVSDSVNIQLRNVCITVDEKSASGHEIENPVVYLGARNNKARGGPNANGIDFFYLERVYFDKNVSIESERPTRGGFRYVFGVDTLTFMPANKDNIYIGSDTENEGLPRTFFNRIVLAGTGDNCAMAARLHLSANEVEVKCLKNRSVFSVSPNVRRVSLQDFESANAYLGPISIRGASNLALNINCGPGIDIYRGRFNEISVHRDPAATSEERRTCKYNTSIDLPEEDEIGKIFLRGTGIGDIHFRGRSFSTIDLRNLDMSDRTLSITSDRVERLLVEGMKWNSLSKVKLATLSESKSIDPFGGTEGSFSGSTPLPSLNQFTSPPSLLESFAKLAQRFLRNNKEYAPVLSDKAGCAAKFFADIQRERLSGSVPRSCDPFQ